MTNYTKIHYKKTEKESLVRSKTYHSASSGKKYSISLYITELEYYIFEEPCGSRIIGGEARSFSGLKKAAKAALIDLGVVFCD